MFLPTERWFQISFGTAVGKADKRGAALVGPGVVGGGTEPHPGATPTLPPPVAAPEGGTAVQEHDSETTDVPQRSTLTRPVGGQVREGHPYFTDENRCGEAASHR